MGCLSPNFKHTLMVYRQTLMLYIIQNDKNQFRTQIFEKWVKHFASIRPNKQLQLFNHQQDANSMLCASDAMLLTSVIVHILQLYKSKHNKSNRYIRKSISFIHSFSKRTAVGSVVSRVSCLKRLRVLLLDDSAVLTSFRPAPPAFLLFRVSRVFNPQSHRP